MTPKAARSGFSRPYATEFLCCVDDARPAARPNGQPALDAPSAAAPCVKRVPTHALRQESPFYTDASGSRGLNGRLKRRLGQKLSKAERTAAACTARDEDAGCLLHGLRANKNPRRPYAQNNISILGWSQDGLQTTRKAPLRVGVAFRPLGTRRESNGRPAANAGYRAVSRQLWKIFAISPSCKPAVMACSSGGRT